MNESIMERKFPRTYLCFQMVQTYCFRHIPYADNFLPAMIRICVLANHDHADSPRVFAHTLHVEEYICVSHNFELLADSYQFGIMFHEFAHLFCEYLYEEHTEEDADDFSRIELGIPLVYDTSLEVQCIPLDDLERIFSEDDTRVYNSPIIHTANGLDIDVVGDYAGKHPLVVNCRKKNC
jgi:hypothetical protein